MSPRGVTALYFLTFTVPCWVSGHGLNAEGGTKVTKTQSTPALTMLIQGSRETLVFIVK